MPRPAIFLDRDGVINRKADGSSGSIYIRTVSELEFLPGAIQAIAHISDMGYEIFIVTNQRGIARRLVSADALDEIHRAILAAVQREGGSIRKIYVCPHDYSDNCDCRKPKPGLLLRAREEFGIDLASSWMIGDSSSDISAGRAANCRTVFIGSSEAGVGADLAAVSLAHAAGQIALAESRPHVYASAKPDDGRRSRS